jgi:O-antigen/teichoic acid export membrane protein
VASVELTAKFPVESSDRAVGRHIRGSVVLVLGRVLAIILNFVVQVLTVRYLSKADYGTLAYALAISNMLAVALALGMNKSASRFLAVYLQDRDHARFWGAICVIFGSILLISLVALSGLYWFVKFGYLGRSFSAQAELVLLLCAWLSLANAVDSVFIAIFAVMAKPSAIFFRRYLLAPSTKLAAALAVIACSGGVIAFTVGQLIAGILGVVLCLILFKQLIQEDNELAQAFHRRFRYPTRELLTHSLSIMGGDVAFMMRVALVPVVLGVYYAAEDVANFLAVQPIAKLTEFVLVTFAIQFVPQAARLAESRQTQQLQRLYEHSLAWITVLSFPIFAACFIGSESIPTVLFGAEYANASAILQWLSLAFFAYASFGTTQRLLRATCSISVMLISDISTTIISVISVIYLTITYSAVGGAVAVFITFALQSAINIWLVRNYTSINPLRPICWTPFFTGVFICCFANWGANQLGGHPIVDVCATILAVGLMTLCYIDNLQISEVVPELRKIPLLRKFARIRT